MRDSIKFYLITPARDEAANLVQTIASVVTSTYRPDIWIIVDDCSTDNTGSIADRASIEHTWIQVIHRAPCESRDSVSGYTDAVLPGMERAQHELSRYNPHHTYIGLLDADIAVEPEHFHVLLQQVESDPSLGVICGDLYVEQAGQWVLEAVGDGMRGGMRIHRQSCLMDIGGYPRTPAPDTVTDFRARRKGWLVKRVHTARAFQARHTATKYSVQRSYLRRGRIFYRLRMDALTALALFLITSKRKGLQAGCWLLAGYASSALSRARRDSDESLKFIWRDAWDGRLRHITSGLAAKRGLAKHDG